jgi:abequosyltransferase
MAILDTTIKISICIATRNRADIIGETLKSIILQATEEVEIIVLDGASTDNTKQVIQQFKNSFPRLNYICKDSNGGVDRDYSESVEFAAGDYCWFMSDDDVLKDGAIQKVLSHTQQGYDLIIVNAENRICDLSKVLEKRQLKINEDRIYKPADNQALFADVAKHVSYIPAVVIKRQVWNARDKESYYGTGFVHVGVIFQKVFENDVLVIAEPLIMARQGNTSWSDKAFEIWMFLWPNLIWSFSDYSDSIKQKVFPKEPWRKLHLLLAYRGKGLYSEKEYKRLPTTSNGRYKIIARIIANLPLWFVKPLFFIYLIIFEPEKRTTLYGLLGNSFLKNHF